ncbi:MAG: DUF2089 domain-containing protein [Propioniciclava sp.]
MSAPSHLHRAPADCPVCGERLAVSRLGCPGCGTELVGSFATCPYCALGEADLGLLRVFLTSRGNLKEVEKHLGVSYPTARSRFNDLLDRLGMLEHQDGDQGSASPHEPDPDQEAESVHRPGSFASEPSAEAAPPVGNDVRDQILAQVASGTLAPDVAADLLARL